MDLSPEFSKEAKDTITSFKSILHSELNKKKFSTEDIHLYSSGSERCLELAKILAKEWNLTILQDDRLLEYDFGEWEGQPWDKIDPEELEPWMKDFVNIFPPGGESLQTFYNRVYAFLNELRSSDNKLIFLVTHGGTIRMIKSCLLNIPLESMFKIHVRYGKPYRFFLGKNSQEDMVY